MEETAARAVTKQGENTEETKDGLPMEVCQRAGRRAGRKVTIEERKDRRSSYCSQISGTYLYSSLCMRPRSTPSLLRELVLHQLSREQIEGACSSFRSCPSTFSSFSRPDSAAVGDILYSRMLERAWTSLLLPSLRHRHSSREDVETKSETVPGIGPLHSSSSLSLWVYEWSQHLRVCGQEEEGAALLLLTDVFRHRKSFPTRTSFSLRPSFRSSRSRGLVKNCISCTHLNDNREAGTTSSCLLLKEHERILLLLLLLSRPVSSTALQTKEGVSRSNCFLPYGPTVEGSRASEVSRQVLHAAFLSTPQLDQRALRGTLRRPLGSYEEDEKREEALCWGGNAGGIRVSQRAWGVHTPETQEQIHSAAKRLGLHLRENDGDTFKETRRDGGVEATGISPETAEMQERTFQLPGEQSSETASDEDVASTEEDPAQEEGDASRDNTSAFACFRDWRSTPPLSSASPTYLSASKRGSSFSLRSRSSSSTPSLLPQGSPVCSAFACPRSVASLFQSSISPSESCRFPLSNRIPPVPPVETDTSSSYLRPSGVHTPGTHTSPPSSSTSFFRSDCLAALQARMNSSHPSSYDPTSADTSRCPFLLSTSPSSPPVPLGRGDTSSRPSYSTLGVSVSSVGSPLPLNPEKDRFAVSMNGLVKNQRSLILSSHAFSQSSCRPSYPPPVHNDFFPEASRSRHFTNRSKALTDEKRGLSDNPPDRISESHLQGSSKEPSFSWSLLRPRDRHNSPRRTSSSSMRVDEETPSFFGGHVFQNRHSLFMDPSLQGELSSQGMHNKTVFSDFQGDTGEGGQTKREDGKEETTDRKAPSVDARGEALGDQGSFTLSKESRHSHSSFTLSPVGEDIRASTPRGGYFRGEHEPRKVPVDIVAVRAGMNGHHLENHSNSLQETSSIPASLSSVRTTHPLDILESEVAAADIAFSTEKGRRSCQNSFLACNKILTSTYASWDCRLLHPRVKTILSSVESQINYGGMAIGERGGKGLENHMRLRWMGHEAMRCMDTRTQGAVASFLSVACGTMTIGGLINRFPLMHSQGTHSRGNPPSSSLLPLPSIIVSRTAEDLRLTPSRPSFPPSLSLSAVLTTPPAPLIPLPKNISSKQVRQSSAVFGPTGVHSSGDPSSFPEQRSPSSLGFQKSLPFWLQECILALQGFENTLFRARHCCICKAFTSHVYRNDSVKGSSSVEGRKVLGKQYFMNSAFTCWLMEGGISKTREKMTIDLTSIFVPPAVDLFASEEKGSLSWIEDGEEAEEKERTVPSLYIHCPSSAGQRPSFICCSDLEYCSPNREERVFTRQNERRRSPPLSSRGSFSKGSKTERRSVFASSGHGRRKSRTKLDQEKNGAQEREFRGEEDNEANSIGEGDDAEEAGRFHTQHTRRDPWEPVMTEVAIVASLLRRLRAFVAFFRPLAFSETKNFARCPFSVWSHERRGTSNLTFSSFPLGLTMQTFVSGLDSILNAFDTFLLSGEVYIHLGITDASLGYSFSPLSLLPALQAWKSRLVFLCRVCRLDFEISRSCPLPSCFSHRSTTPLTASPVWNYHEHLTHARQERERLNSEGRCETNERQDFSTRWWSFPRGSALLGWLFDHTAALQAEAPYTRSPPDFLPLEALMFPEFPLSSIPRSVDFRSPLSLCGEERHRCWSISSELLRQAMTPLLHFLHMWSFCATLHDPGGEFVIPHTGRCMYTDAASGSVLLTEGILRPGVYASPMFYPDHRTSATMFSPSTVRDVVASNRVSGRSMKGDLTGVEESREGALLRFFPSATLARKPCVSSSEGRDDASELAAAVGGAAKIKFVFPPFLQSLQQEIHKTGLLLYILLLASPEAFVAASLATTGGLLSQGGRTFTSQRESSQIVAPMDESRKGNSSFNDGEKLSMPAFAAPSVSVEDFWKSFDSPFSRLKRSDQSMLLDGRPSVDRPLSPSPPVFSPQIFDSPLDTSRHSSTQPPGQRGNSMNASSSPSRKESPPVYTLSVRHVSDCMSNSRHDGNMHGDCLRRLEREGRRSDCERREGQEEAKQSRHRVFASLSQGSNSHFLISFSLDYTILRHLESTYSVIEAEAMSRVQYYLAREEASYLLLQQAKQEETKQLRELVRHRVRLHQQHQLLQLQRARVCRYLSLAATAALADPESINSPEQLLREINRQKRLGQRALLDTQLMEKNKDRAVVAASSQQEEKKIGGRMVASPSLPGSRDSLHLSPSERHHREEYEETKSFLESQLRLQRLELEQLDLQLQEIRELQRQQQLREQSLRDASHQGSPFYTKGGKASRSLRLHRPSSSKLQEMRLNKGLDVAQAAVDTVTKAMEQAEIAATMVKNRLEKNFSSPQDEKRRREEGLIRSELTPTRCSFEGGVKILQPPGGNATIGEILSQGAQENQRKNPESQMSHNLDGDVIQPLQDRSHLQLTARCAEKGIIFEETPGDTQALREGQTSSGTRPQEKGDPKEGQTENSGDTEIHRVASTLAVGDERRGGGALDKTDEEKKIERVVTMRTAKDDGTLVVSLQKVPRMPENQADSLSSPTTQDKASTVNEGGANSVSEENREITKDEKKLMLKMNLDDKDGHTYDVGAGEGHTPTTAPSVSPRSAYSTEEAAYTRRFPVHDDLERDEKKKEEATSILNGEEGVYLFQQRKSRPHSEKSQSLLSRSVWTCIGAAIKAQQEVANVALTVVLAEQGFDLLGCLEIARQIVLFGASDVMGQFAVDLVHELKKKDAKEKQISRLRASSRGNHRAFPTEESRMIESSGERDIVDGEDDEDEEHMQCHWNEKVNALLATAQSSILVGRRDISGRDVVSSQFERREFEGEERRERRSLRGTACKAVGVQISVRIRDRNEGCTGATVSQGCYKREEKKVRSVGNKGVEELLGDIEVVPSVPFPSTLFFDPEARCHYTRIFQFLCLLSFSLHSIHQVWHGLKRLQKSDVRLQPTLRSSPLPPFSHISRDFLLPGGVYTHMWRLCIRMKFVVGALHAYAITDALQSEWTDLSVYIQQSIQAAVASANRFAAKTSPLRESSSSRKQKNGHRLGSVLSGESACTQRQGDVNSSSSTFHFKNTSPRSCATRDPGTSAQSRKRRPDDSESRRENLGGLEILSRDPEYPSGTQGKRSCESRRFDDSPRGLDSCCSVYELIARHRRTLASIYTRCLLSPRLAPLHRHVMDIFRASWSLHTLKDHLDEDERQLRCLLRDQVNLLREISHQRQAMLATKQQNTMGSTVVRASFQNLQLPLDKNENANLTGDNRSGGEGNTDSTPEEQELSAVRRGVERAAAAAGVKAAQQLLQIEKNFEGACEALMSALQKLEPLQLLDALTLRLDFNQFYSRRAAGLLHTESGIFGATPRGSGLRAVGMRRGV
ncbi:spc97 spc98 family [Cystoisospora suis]|uniref:Spc97 spc98 family n=1 Tax=Cystoisospora suis TaxID=483139 RepID=A0A2C6LGZ7_9APIC|nr:spc97 spc98 family [Cystoisospora suis]